MSKPLGSFATIVSTPPSRAAAAISLLARHGWQIAESNVLLDRRVLMSRLLEQNGNTTSQIGQVELP